jgi:DNA-binding protein HU-beta
MRRVGMELVLGRNWPDLLENGFNAIIDDITTIVRGGCAPVNKAELIQAVAKSAGLTNNKAGEVVGAVVEEISSALARGEKVQIAGFGTFETRERAARQARNPQDPSKVVNVPARKVPAFRAGKALKDKVS